MKEIITYETSDGAQFTKRTNAINHENELFEDWLKETEWSKFLDDEDSLSVDEYRYSELEMSRDVLRRMYDWINK